MRTILNVGLAVVFLVGIAGQVAALPPLPKYVEEHYSADPAYAKFSATFKALENDRKCDTCHKADADKKAKGHGLNDFGQAVNKHFNHRQFNAADKQAKDNAEQATKAKQLIVEALVKAESEKNSAGQTFGELLKAGKSPGSN